MVNKNSKSDQNVPEWFERALELYIEHGGVRPVTEALAAEGIDVSRTTVWHWVTPGGRRAYENKMSAGERSKHRVYMRQYMRNRALETRKEA